MTLKTLLAASGETRSDRLTVFAMMNLGMVDALANGLVSPMEALKPFFNAETCLYVKHELESGLANEVMSRGVQLPDVFETLPLDEAHREFQRELSIMCGLCHKILDERRQAATPPRVARKPRASQRSTPSAKGQRLRRSPVPPN